MPDTIPYEQLVKLSQLSRFKTKQDEYNDGRFATKVEFGELEETVEGLELAGGQPNVVETVKVNGTALTPDAQKAVDVTVPTKTSDLTNDDNVVKDASYVHTDVNFTQAKDEKLTAIAAGAEVNVIDSVKVNGTAQTVTNKEIDIAVPTNNNQLANGAGYQTASDVATAVEAYGYQTASDVSTAIAGKADSADLGTAAAANSESTLTDGANLPTGAAVKSFVEGKGYQTSADVQSAIGTAIATAMDYKGVVADMTALQAISNPKTGDVYHVTASGSEYAWNGSAWEELGVTFDATGFVQESQISLATDADIDALFASGE